MSKPRTSNTIRNLKIGTGISVLALSVITLLSLLNARAVINRYEWVDHTNKVLIHLESIISNLKGAETGQRGYLLTQNPEFLEPYVNSYNDVFEAYNEVRQLTIDNKSQQLRLDTLRTLIAAKFEGIKETIRLERQGQSAAARQRVASKAGKRTMDRIRFLVDDMRNEELRLREKRYTALKSTSYYAPFLVLTLSVIALAVAVIYHFILVKDARRRLQAEGMLQETNVELEQSNDELEQTNEELEQSNEELSSREEQLHEMNVDLEAKVNQKAREIIAGMQQLEQSEVRFRLLVESIKDYAIFMMSPEGHITSWNPGAKNLKGYSEEEILGKHFSIFYPEEIKYHYPAYELKKAIELGRFEDEGWRVRKDGSMFWANVIITPVYDEARNHIGYSKITRDLTERKKAEDLLRRINNDLDNFIYTASHDLKAPINNLEGLIMTVSEEVEKQCRDGIRELFDLMNKSVERLKLIIHELSDISQVRQYEETDIADIDLEELTEEFRFSHEKEISTSGASIYTDFGINVFPFSKRNLRSIVYNLLTNAIKYRSPDRNPEILLKSYRKDQWFVISCKDNGLGFDPKYKDKAFGMFKRLHDHVEGTGVGLYIVKKIIENAGGTIQVESEPGKGSTFTVYLPIKS